jgi:hypothetical protein
MVEVMDAKSIVMVEAMGAMIRSIEMVATTGARSAEMVEAMVALMTKIVGVQMAVLMVKGMVDSKEVVVVVVLPLPSKMSCVRFAKKYGHPANECWWRYTDKDDDDNSRADEKGAYGVDTNRYRPLTISRVN